MKDVPYRGRHECPGSRKLGYDTKARARVAAARAGWRGTPMGVYKCIGCRRSHATLLVERGVDRDVVRRLLGHTTTAMVDRVYGQPRVEALAALAEHSLGSTQHLRDTPGETMQKTEPPSRLELETYGLRNRTPLPQLGPLRAKTLELAGADGLESGSRAGANATSTRHPVSSPGGHALALAAESVFGRHAARQAVARG